MAHKLYRITDFKQIDTYTLWLAFDDGTEQTIDFAPLLVGPLFGSLQDPTLFAQVALDPVAQTVVWPNGVDFDPETLRNWPDYAEQFIGRVQALVTTAV